MGLELQRYGACGNPLNDFHKLNSPDMLHQAQHRREVGDNSTNPAPVRTYAPAKKGSHTVLAAGHPTPPPWQPARRITHHASAMCKVPYRTCVLLARFGTEH